MRQRSDAPQLLGLAPAKTPKNACPCPDELDVYDRRRQGLVFDCIDCWRASPERVRRLSARLWSFWSRSPHFFATWAVGEKFKLWRGVAHGIFAAPFFDCLDEARRVSDGDNLALDSTHLWLKGHVLWSAWRRILIVHDPVGADVASVFHSQTRDAMAQAQLWNERTQPMQSLALRLLLTATAGCERGEHDWPQPYQLCGLPFAEVWSTMRGQGVSARHVLAADLAVVQSHSTTYLDVHSVRLEGLTPRDANDPSDDRCRCLVLLLLGDHVAAHAWSARGPSGTHVALVNFSVPGCSVASARFVVLWVRAADEYGDGGNSGGENYKGVPIAPFAPFDIYARVSRVNVCSQLHHWVLDLQTHLSTCYGVTSRLDDHLHINERRPVDTELLAIEIDEVMTMIRACGSTADLLSARRRRGRWRLPPGSCGCGCQEEGSPTGHTCSFAGVPDVRDYETRPHNNSHKQRACLGQQKQQRPRSVLKTKETTCSDSVTLTHGDKRHSLSNASMDATLALLQQTGHLARMATPTW